MAHDLQGGSSSAPTEIEGVISGFKGLKKPK
jgi:hypothetical protein